MSFCIVRVTETGQPLAVCKSPKAAAKHISKLPPDGEYSIDDRKKTVVLAIPKPPVSDWLATQ